MAKIKADQLTKEVWTLLNRYARDSGISYYDEALRIARKGAKMLRADSRKQFGKGEYSEGWKVETRGNKHRQVTWSHTIYNEHYSLPHLLEHGHVTKNGTERVYERTPAHVHIQPIHDQLVKEYEDFLLEWFNV